jgi:hypothetical protein
LPRDGAHADSCWLGFWERAWQSLFIKDLGLGARLLRRSITNIPSTSTRRAAQICIHGGRVGSGLSPRAM